MSNYEFLSKLNILSNAADINFIIESLNYIKLKFENYEQYLSYEFKQKRIEDVNNVLQKVRELKKQFNNYSELRKAAL